MKFVLLTVVLCLAELSKAQTGIPVPTMTQSDNIISNFLAAYSIPAATVAIAKDGKIVYMRAFGHSDIGNTTLTQPYNMFRIASLSKQITSITIMKMMEAGLLTMSSKVFGPGGILQNHPAFASANITDSRIYNITIQNLLEHSGGWNRDLDCNPNPTLPYPYFLSGCDPISFPLRVTQLTATTNPVSKDALIKFLLEKGLDFAPGTSYNYSNIGFLILGEVIEQLSGQTYETYVKNNILAPLGIFDMHIAKNLLTEKQEREGEYVGNGYTTLSCYGDGTYVPWEYGGFSVNAMDSHGGWIASSRDMLKLLVAVDGFSTKPDILQPATIATMTTPSANNQYYAKGWSVNSANNWWHTGSLDGTASEQVRAANGFTWIIILNKRDIATNTNFWTDLDNLGWNCLAATTTWPTWDLMVSPTVNAQNITFTNVTSTSITVNWSNGNGEKRLLLARGNAAVNAFPLDGTDYTGNTVFGTGTSTGANNYVVYNGTGSSVTVTGLTPNTAYYFRVAEYNKDAASGNNALYVLGENPVASQATARPLPVTLLDFNAVKTTNKKTMLTWQTAQELNSATFDIQRSADGSNFYSIGLLPAAGNSSVTTNYSFTDQHPLAGLNYYRLKEVDLDGNATNSKIVALDYNGGAGFRVHASHDRYSFTISSNGVSLEHATLLLRDAAGRTLLRQTLAASNTNTVFTKSPLVGGIYFITVITGGQPQTQKLVVD